MVINRSAHSNADNFSRAAVLGVARLGLQHRRCARVEWSAGHFIFHRLIWVALAMLLHAKCAITESSSTVQYCQYLV